MKFNAYKLLLWIALVWQCYLAFPDEMLLNLYRIVPVAVLFNLCFDALLIGLLITGLVMEKKHRDGTSK